MVIFSIYITYIGLINVVTVNKDKIRRNLPYFFGFLLFIICALRSYKFGPDVPGYVDKYISLQEQHLYDLFLNFIKGVGKDPFFYLFSKIFSLIGFSYQMWLAVISFIYCFSVSKFFKENSRDHFLSFLGLISLGYLFFSLTGLRQSLAIAMVLFSFKYLKNNRFLPFFLFVVAGSMFHFSAIVFLISYPLRKMKITFNHFLFLIFFLIFVIIFKNKLLYYLQFFDVMDKYPSFFENPSVLNLTGFIIQLIIFIFCLIYYNNTYILDKSSVSIYSILFIGLLFQALSLVIAEFFRISMYFSIFSLILIPISIKSEPQKPIQNLIYMAVTCTLILYFFLSQSFAGFHFFW